MVRISKPGIKRSVLFVALLPATIVAIFLTLYFSYAQSKRLVESLNERGISIIRQLAPASEYGVYSGNLNILQNLIESVKRESDVRSVTIRNKDGIILVEIGPKSRTSTGLLLSDQKIQNIVSDDGKSMLFHSPVYQVEFIKRQETDTEEDIIDSEKPDLIQTNRVLGWVSVELSMERTHAFQIKYWRNTTLISLSILVFSAFLAIRMGRNITQPITELKNAVSNLASGDLEIQVKTDATGEIKSLENGINSMAVALKTSRLHLEEKIEDATTNLLDTLTVLEERNSEIDLARREAEHANKSKSDFLANISHEIRTPLNGIQGFLLLLKKTRLEATQTEYLDKIEISTKNLLTLINDILNFSKIEAAKINLINTEYELRSLLDECVDVCMPDLQQKGLDIYIIVDPEIPTLVIGDPDRISQIIKNLVSNAVKFTSKGHIIIQAELYNSPTGKEQLNISVLDTGIGIPHNDLQQLFQPFSQLESGMDRRYGGTGLGLVITKSLTEMMGGTISVESTPKHGSRFTVCMPLQKTDNPRSSRFIENTYSNLNIHIVSSDKLITQSLQNLLSHWKVNSSSSCELIDNLMNFNAIIYDENNSFSRINNITKLSALKNRNHRPFLILLKSITSEIDDKTSIYYKTFDKIISRPPNSKEIINYISETIVKDFSSSSNQNDTEVHSSYKLIKSLNVLVADDNDINRQFLVTWLNQLGATTDEAENGQDAIRQCSVKKYDLILMDLHMPEVNGITAASVIRNSQLHLSQTPIIAITADATESARKTILQSSLDDIIIKPVSEEQLTSIIAKWCPDIISTSTGHDKIDKLDQNPENNDVVDIEKGIQFASGDKEMWISSISTLISRLPEQQLAINNSIDNLDFNQISEIAHNIVGAASYCGAKEIQRAAKDLELQAKSHEIEKIIIAGSALDKEIRNIIHWKNKYISAYEK